MPKITGLLALVVLLATSTIAAATHSYVVTVDADLTRLETRAKFSIPIHDVSARSRTAQQFLSIARDCDNNLPLKVRGRRLVLPEAGLRCLSYVVDLKKAARADQRNAALHPANIVVSPTVWMWHPRLVAGEDITVRFEVSNNNTVSVPWPRINDTDNSYSLAASPQSSTAVAAFGQFESRSIQVGDVQLATIVLRSRSEFNSVAIVEWVRDNAINITRTYGRFPNPHARVVVLPQANRRRESAVQFGRVVRDGGETVELLIDPDLPIEAFYDSWTATHEFSHLMLPYVDSSGRWISEGFAQYYQNVLLARSGRYTQQYAWQKIHDGLQRGRASAPTMSPNEAAAADQRDTRMKVYWSGAALALLADTELRRRSNGSESLDSVLDRLQRCCLPSARTWSGRELFARFDSFIDEPLFVGLYEEYANAKGFPDTRLLLQQLGVSVNATEATLNDESELAKIRAAITARRYTDESNN